YALGLFSFGGIKILVTAFHALQDTKTPVKIAAACLGLNAVLNFILMVPLKIGGVALASSIAGTVNFAALFVMMSKRLGSFPSGLVKYAGKVIAAALLTGIFSEALWAARGFSVGISTLGLVGISALAFYVAVCWILRIEQAREIMRRVCPVLHRP
ncbi:MAG TPA: lipid II flippase MurJ, partial [Candidatus Omnitrophota bacterium]|nr:lipid II flippase MurJ [Candidatus Omnitrophota bacterium]